MKGVSPLSEELTGAGLGVLGVAILVIGAVVWLLNGCGGGFDAAAYAQDDARCVMDAKTREEADNCRQLVRAKYNLPQRADGGVK